MEKRKGAGGLWRALNWVYGLYPSAASYPSQFTLVTPHTPAEGGADAKAPLFQISCQVLTAPKI